MKEILFSIELIKNKVKNVPNCLSFQIYCHYFPTPGVVLKFSKLVLGKTFKLSKVLSQFDLYF